MDNCATLCADELASLPVVSFNESCPEINQGEISAIYLGIRGNPFTDVASAAEWAARLGALTTDATRIVRLAVIGDKPRPGANVVSISGGRRVNMPKDHVINFTVDETNAANHTAMQKMQCSGGYDIWYETSGGLLFGGNRGLQASVDIDMSVPRERGGLIVYEGTATWNAKQTEDRIVSPIA